MHSRAAILLLVLLFPAGAYAAQININTADAALLDTLPGIGPTKAAAIIDYRTQHGPFTSIDDIQHVSGIGPVTFANIKDSITVGTAQPDRTQPSYKPVKAVEPINSPEDTKVHDATGLAPAATHTGAAGAPVAAPPASAPHLFSSPWTLALIGVIILASGIFIFI